MGLGTGEEEQAEEGCELTGPTAAEALSLRGRRLVVMGPTLSLSVPLP